MKPFLARRIATRTVLLSKHWSFANGSLLCTILSVFCLIYVTLLCLQQLLCIKINSLQHKSVPEYPKGSAEQGMHIFSALDCSYWPLVFASFEYFCVYICKIFVPAAAFVHENQLACAQTAAASNPGTAWRSFPNFALGLKFFDSTDSNVFGSLFRRIMSNSACSFP